VQSRLLKKGKKKELADFFKDRHRYRSDRSLGIDHLAKRKQPIHFF